MELRATVLESGCCGMAGAFGYEREKYAVSHAVGEGVLLPAVRKAPDSTLVVADGFSCREQIAQNTDRGALHVAEVLDMVLRRGQERPKERPEASVVRRRRRRVWRSRSWARALHVRRGVEATRATVLSLALLVACGAGPPRGAAEITGATAPGVVNRGVELARARTSTLAVDGTTVYYGTADELRSVPKTGGASAVVGEPGPADVVLTPMWIHWISLARDRVLRVSHDSASRSAPETVLEGGPFYALGADGRDVWLTSAESETGALLHLLPGAGAVRVAGFDGRADAIAVAGDDVFVQTRGGVYRVPRVGPSAGRIWSGTDVSGLAVDDAFVYTSAQIGPSRALVRMPRQGGAVVELERAVRDAPVSLFGIDLFYFDAEQPVLRRVGKRGGASTTVARSLALGEPTALVVDFTGIFVGSAYDGGRVLALPMPPRE
jgi:hypothetical protein